MAHLHDGAAPLVVRARKAALDCADKRERIRDIHYAYTENQCGISQPMLPDNQGSQKRYPKQYRHGRFDNLPIYRRRFLAIPILGIGAGEQGELPTSNLPEDQPTTQGD